MNTILENIIKSVDDVFEWVKTYSKSAEQAELFAEIVDVKRKLRRIHRANLDNPTIAAYGESQVGKSYIVTSLLGSSGRPFSVKTESGERLNFIDNFNYKTKSQESTGVVTRFTSSKTSVNEHYAIKLKLLSIADIITILADCYFVDINGYEPWTQGDWEAFADDIYERYNDKPEVQSYLTELEIGDIQEYLVNYDKKQAASLLNSEFLARLSMLIRRIPVSDWEKVFAYLWKNDEAVSRLFRRLLDCYVALNFSETVYINTKVVLNDMNDGEPTLMSVTVLDKLKEIFSGKENMVKVPVLFPNGVTVVQIEKCLLSAITAEAVYNIEEAVLSDRVTITLDHIRQSPGRSAEDNKKAIIKNLGLSPTDILPAGVNKEEYLVCDKSFLKSIDLLDFPGARGRASGYQPGQISAEIAKLLLRGKVTYLFNKYSEELRLSVLMFCHHHKNTTPNLVAPLLSNWIGTYIGRTPEERRKVTERYDRISPLFLISTMYNADLEIPTDHEGNPMLDRGVWAKRLGKIWASEVIDMEVNTWFKDWIPGGRFANTYLLRDYKYSSNLPGDGICHLFKGYPGTECDEINAEARIRLKEIFLQDDSVKMFFEDPELSWNVSSTVANDGSCYIIKRLSQVSKLAGDARKTKFLEDALKYARSLYAIMKPKYKDTSAVQRLEENIKKANKFDFQVRKVVEKHPDFFGRMIQFLQLNIHMTTKVLYSVVHSTQIVDVEVPKEYEVLLAGVEERGYSFDPQRDDDYNRNIFINAYGFPPEEEDIDIHELAKASYKRDCSPSIVMATKLLETWFEELSSSGRSHYFSQVGFRPTVFTSFIENIIASSIKVELKEKIASAISEYVDDKLTTYPENEALIADIATSIYNAFIMDLGFSYLGAEDVAKVADIASKTTTFNYGLIHKDGAGAVSENLEDKLFNSLDSLGEDGSHLTQLPSYQNLIEWIEYVKMSYIMSSDVPDMDEMALLANDKLGCILKEFEKNVNPTI